MPLALVETNPNPLGWVFLTKSSCRSKTPAPVQPSPFVIDHLIFGLANVSWHGLAMPATPVPSGETTAEPAMSVETVSGPAVETVSESAAETVAETVVEMRKSLCHHDSGPKPEEPRFGGPIRIIKRIGVVIRIRVARGILSRWGNYVDLWRQSRRSLGDPPAPIGLLARLHDGLLLLAADRYRNGVVGAGWLVGRRFRSGGRACWCHRIGLRLASRAREDHR